MKHLSLAKISFAVTVSAITLNSCIEAESAETKDFCACINYEKTLSESQKKDKDLNCESIYLEVNRENFLSEGLSDEEVEKHMAELEDKLEELKKSCIN